ncbi:hypothetical protein [Mangrovibacterium lignilyticum]
MQSGRLRTNDKILLLVPESGRFSYGTALLPVESGDHQNGLPDKCR